MYFKLDWVCLMTHHGIHKQNDRGNTVEVLTLLLADFASFDDSKKLNVMGIFNEVNAKQFPALHPSMVVVTKLSATAAEANLVRKLNIKLMDDDATLTLVDFKRDITIQEPTAGRRKEFANILRLNNIMFPHAGTYQVSVLIDGDDKGHTPLYVVHVQ